MDIRITFFIFLFYIVVPIVAWLIFYYTIKAAVKNGILEARAYKETPADKSNIIIEYPINEEQNKL